MIPFLYVFGVKESNEMVILWSEVNFDFLEMFKNGTEPKNVAKFDLKWPLGDLRGQSWPLITKITIASYSLTPKTYRKWCHLSIWLNLNF